MKLTIDVKGVDAATKALVESLSPRRINAVAAGALTRAAVAGRAAVQTEMRSVFDKPTPYTIASVRYREATADRLVSEVYISQKKGPRDPSPAVVLKPQVEGGGRGFKGLELALRAAGVLPSGWFVTPGAGARLDAFGNVSRGLITQVIQQVRIRAQPLPKDARRNAKLVRRTGGVIFAVSPAAKGKGPAPGVYIADAVGRNVTPLFKFVNRASYRQRLRFAEVVGQEVQRVLPSLVAQGLGESIGRKAGGAGSRVVR